MRRPALIILILIILAAGAFALMHKTNTPSADSTQKNAPAASSGQPTAGSINITNMIFTPSQITVAVGGTVTWTNNDTTTHTVVDDLSNVNGPHSGDIAPGQTYSFKFTKAGSYQYHCSIHPSMRGTIVVK